MTALWSYGALRHIAAYSENDATFRMALRGTASCVNAALQQNRPNL